MLLFVTAVDEATEFFKVVGLEEIGVTPREGFAVAGDHGADEDFAKKLAETGLVAKLADEAVGPNVELEVGIGGLGGGEIGIANSAVATDLIGEAADRACGFVERGASDGFAFFGDTRDGGGAKGGVKITKHTDEVFAGVDREVEGEFFQISVLGESFFSVIVTAIGGNVAGFVFGEIMDEKEMDLVEEEVGVKGAELREAVVEGEKVDNRKIGVFGDRFATAAREGII